MATRQDHQINELTITGYKSIRELKSFSLVNGLNVLIGANGSGKTNFIRFFELLAHIFDPNKGLQRYVAERGRADAFLFRGMKVTPELSAELAFGRNRYKFSLHAAEDRSLFFSHESAPFDGPFHGPIKNDQGSGHLESLLPRLKNTSASIDWVVSTVRAWRVYHFHDTSPSAPVMGLCNMVDHFALHGNAANLAAFLKAMQETHPEAYTRIVEAVRQVAPFFGDFVLKETGPGQTQLLWKDRHSDLIYYPHQLSDGTLRFICLATLLLQPEPPITIIIDEPELGLHPYAIKLLASMLHDAARSCQLIVSTQSSLLVDELTPEQIIVVNHKNGESVFERQDPKRLEDWLKSYTMGQLWEKNELGGVP